MGRRPCAARTRALLCPPWGCNSLVSYGATRQLQRLLIHVYTSVSARGSLFSLPRGSFCVEAPSRGHGQLDPRSPLLPVAATSRPKSAPRDPDRRFRRPRPSWRGSARRLRLLACRTAADAHAREPRKELRPRPPGCPGGRHAANTCVRVPGDLAWPCIHPGPLYEHVPPSFRPPPSVRVSRLGPIPGVPPLGPDRPSKAAVPCDKDRCSTPSATSLVPYAPPTSTSRGR